MNIFIFTLGSRGDVQPYVALGKGLQGAGHAVTLCTSASFEGFITGHGLQYGQMNDEFVEFIKSAEGRDVIENTSNLWEGIKTSIRTLKHVGPMQRHAIDDAWKAAQAARPDLIIFHPKGFGGPQFAEKLGVPAILAFYLPIYVPSVYEPCIGFPRWKLGGWYNKLTYRLVRYVTKLASNSYVKYWRRQHGLPRQPWGADMLRTAAGEQIEVVHAFSRHVVPPPQDWPASAMPTGFWFLDSNENWRPPPALREFLAAGEPPVYVGFGSLSGSDPARLGRLVVEALTQAGVRGVLATGWGGLDVGGLPQTILKIDEAPHDWLFPQMAAVVHHGGVGTTSAGLRAGRPTVICPFFGDQPFWGRRVHALGAGSRPLPQKNLTAEALAEAIRLVTTDPAIRQNATALGEKIRQENGVANAVAAIERILAAPRMTPSPG
jgi:sterol 3beta-glucosyltransferase